MVFEKPRAHGLHMGREFARWRCQAVFHFRRHLGVDLANDQTVSFLSVHIALREVGAAFEPVRVDLRTHQLPDGSRHSEAAALLQYVADLDPSQALIGAHRAPRRLAIIEWLTFVSTGLHKTFGPLWNPQTAESTRAAATRTLASRFAELEQHFNEHAHLAGDFSVADAYAFAALSWAEPLGQSLAPYPKLKSYLGRVASRPHVQAALRAEGLTS